MRIDGTWGRDHRRDLRFPAGDPVLAKRSQGHNTDETKRRQTALKSEVRNRRSTVKTDGGGAVFGALSVVSSAIASTCTSAASALASAGRHVDATFSAGSLDNARSALGERERAERLRRAVDDAYRDMEFDRSA